MQLGVVCYRIVDFAALVQAVLAVLSHPLLCQPIL